MDLLDTEPAAVDQAKVAPPAPAARAPRADFRPGVVHAVRPVLLALLGLTAGAAVVFLLVSWRTGAVPPESSPPAPIPRGMIRVSSASEAPIRPLEVRSLASSDLPSLLHDAFRTAVDYAEAGNIEQATLAYHDALMMGRDDPHALSNLMSLRRRYQDALLVESRFARIREAFELEDFRGGLASLYRLPSDAPAARVRRACANGWYDLAVVALRAGRCDEAARDLGEARGLGLPASGARAATALARRCARDSGERSFLAAAESMPFRGIDE